MSSGNVENREGQLPIAVENNRITRRFFDFVPDDMLNAVTLGLGVDKDAFLRENFGENFDANDFIESEAGKVFDAIHRRRDTRVFEVIMERFRQHLSDTSFLTEPAIRYILHQYRVEQMHGVTRGEVSQLQSELDLYLPEERIFTGGIHHETEAPLIEEPILRGFIYVRKTSRLFTRRFLNRLETSLQADSERIIEVTPSDPQPLFEPAIIRDPYPLPTPEEWQTAFEAKHFPLE